MIDNISTQISFHDHSINWSDVKAHVNREHSNYSNKHIDLSKSDENVSGMIHDLDDDNNKRFALYIYLHNLWEKSHGHKNRIYKSTHDFFKKNKISPERNTIFKLANEATRKKYYKYLMKKGFTPSQIRSIENNALIDTVQDYEHSTNQHVGYFTSNLDESGGAHVHLQNGSCPTISQAKNAINNYYRGSNLRLSTITHRKARFINYFKHPVNFTPRGKKWKRRLKNHLINDLKIKPHDADYFAHHTIIQRPSTSFNDALCIMHPEAVNAKGQPDSRKAMSKANLNISKILVKNFNKELARSGANLKFNLVRTGKTTNLSYSAYEASMENQKQQRNKHQTESSIADEAYTNYIAPAVNDLKRSKADYIKSSISASNSASKASKLISSANSAITSKSLAQSRQVDTLLTSIATSQVKKEKSFAKVSSSASQKAKLISKASSSLSSTSASFDSSAYGGYAHQLSNVLSPYMRESNPNWMLYAKGKKYFNDYVYHKKKIKSPLRYIADYLSNQASSASSANNSLQTKNQDLNQKNKALSNKNTSLYSDYNGYRHDNNKLMSQIGQKQRKLKGLDTKQYIFTNSVKNHLTTLGMKPNKIPNKSLFSTLIDKVHSVVKYAKNKAHHIISNAKQRAKQWAGINDNGYDLIVEFIQNHNSKAKPNPNANELKDGYFDPWSLNSNQILKIYNKTANQVHKERAKQYQSGRYWGD